MKIRYATSADQEAICRAIFAAWRWRHSWDDQSYLEHRARGGADSYVDGFDQQPGDTGFLAVEGRRVVGAAWYRLFTTEKHREGFVAEDMPELVIAVDQAMRGQGIGRALINRLIAEADAAGLRGMSLHVSADNIAAQSLYKSLGFTTSSDHDNSHIMAKEFNASA